MTGKLRPVELEIEGFRSFVDNALIRFPDVKRGAILINGTYKGSSTSSGSGKSSVLMAMAFALGFCDVPSTELKSWYSKKMHVRFRLADDNNVYDIIRDPKLRLITNGVEYAGTATGAAEKLDEILKASPELIKALTYRPQREKGLFLTNTDTKNKEFLTKILGLDAIELASDSFSAEISAINIKIQSLESNLIQATSSYNSSSVDESQIAAATEAFNYADSRLKALENTSAVYSGIKRELDLIEGELVKITRAQLEVNSAKQQNMGIRQRIELLQSEIDTLMSGVCPTCDREWNKYHALVDQKNGQIASFLESMKSNLVLVKNAEPLLNPDFQLKLSNRKSELHAELGKLSAPVADATSAWNMAKGNLANLNRMKSLNADLLASINEINEKISNLRIDSFLVDHSSKLIGRQGFLGGIFDEVLAEIKRRANDLMSYIPNVDTFSIDISSNSVTQAGKVNKKIKVSMFKDGLEKSLKALSGGQTASLELCTDLSVSETIKSRSGSNLGWVALDEAMNELDVETKMAALNIIKSQVDGLLIVVDHSTEIKEAFDMVIDIEYDGKRSYVL